MSVELIGFEGSSLLAEVSGTLSYFIGPTAFRRHVLVVKGLHEDYLDSLYDVAEVTVFRGGAKIGIGDGISMHIHDAVCDKTMPTLSTSQVKILAPVNSRLLNGPQDWEIGEYEYEQVRRCHQVLRGMADETFQSGLRKSVYAFTRKNGLSLEEVVQSRMAHQGWTDAIARALRKIYGSEFQMPDCQCEACMTLAPESPRRRHVRVPVTIPGQCFSYDNFQINDGLRILVVVDDFTSYGWIWKLDLKSDLPSILKNFDELISTHLYARFGHHVVPAYRADGAGENRVFARWCDENNRIHYFSPPGSQWSNGKAERIGGIIRTGGEKHRRHAGADPSDSFDATEYFNYIRNRTPRKYVVNDKTFDAIPYNLWNNVDIDFKELLHEFHPWGCQVHVITTHQLREKTPVQSEKSSAREATFLGVPR